MSITSAIVVAILFFVGCHLIRDGIHRWRTPQPEGENSRFGIWINRRDRPHASEPPHGR